MQAQERDEFPGGSGGVVRRLDQLGRVVVPAELRKALGIRHGDLIETRMENGRVVIRKFEPDCTFCGGAADLVELREKHVCNDCVRALFEETMRAPRDEAPVRRVEPRFEAATSMR
ncbi:MAG TPA: AbrB/MazE/SpoVT family DNA-binding domain-containing protein [Acidimicrobiia bacterium]